MATATLKAGFHGTDSETYYVAPSGRAWIVSSEDDLGTQEPVEIKAEDIPASATSVDDLLTPDEAIDCLRRIESAFGVSLLETA